MICVAIYREEWDLIKGSSPRIRLRSKDLRWYCIHVHKTKIPTSDRETPLNFRFQLHLMFTFPGRPFPTAIYNMYLNDKHCVWDPMPGLTITYADSRFDSNKIIMGNPMPESTLTLVESGLRLLLPLIQRPSPESWGAHRCKKKETNRPYFKSLSLAEGVLL